MASNIRSFITFGFLLVQCSCSIAQHNCSSQSVHNLTSSNYTRETTSHYEWVVGEHDEQLEYSENFGCTSASCNVSKVFMIIGECVNPWMTVRILETFYEDNADEYRYASIYANSFFVGKCVGLNEQCTYDWVTCANAFYYDLSSIMNTSYSNFCDTNDCDSNNTNIVEITLSKTNEFPNWENTRDCTYTVYANESNCLVSYSLYAQVTLGCGFGHLASPTVKICANDDDCVNQTLSNWNTVYCMNEYSCANSVIFNVNNVWCNQKYSCHNVNFTSINNITSLQTKKKNVVHLTRS